MSAPFRSWDYWTTMNDPRTAELVGAHVAMSVPIARVWHRVAHGALAPERAAALVEDDAERERALRIFTPPTAERREQQLTALFARLAAEPGHEARVEGAGPALSRD